MLPLYPEPDGAGRTDGWAGSQASHERAVAEVRTGRAQQRRMDVIRALSVAGHDGLTWREVADRLGLHHGQASGTLSVLHSEGRISCLTSKRSKCHIYVMNSAVNGRTTREPGHTAAARREVELAATLEDRVAQARAEAADVGWQAGYDAAMAEVAAQPTIDEQITEARGQGFSDGRGQEAVRIMRLLAAMRDTMTKTGGNRMHNHTGICWMENPLCALDAIEKGVARGVPPRPRDAS
jgi:hypothetical protein